MRIAERERSISPEIEIRRKLGRRITIVVVIIALIAIYLFWTFTPNAPVDYADIQEHFKYGSIGSEPVNGIPYWIWKVLPEMFPEKLPDSERGYAGFGFLYEPGRDLPIGFSKRRVFIDRVGLNCAICHVGTVRDTPRSIPRIILGMPANNLDLQGYLRFLTASARDIRFTAENVLQAIARKTELNFIEKFLYRIAIWQTREGLIKQGELLSFMDSRPDWGPGRVDTFNPYKALIFRFPMDEDQTIGSADLPSIWNQRPREGLQLHWDGNNSSVEERNKSAAIGAGVTPTTIDLQRMKRIEDWLWDFKAPPYPYPIDENLAAQGKALYQTYCAACHDFGGAQVGKVVPIEELGTDPHRLDSYTYALLSNQNTLFAGYPWRFKHFRKTNGYASMPLDGIWLRAPYLHNGSVPTLRDLLEAPEQRPQVFYRGYDVYDQDHVGFISNVPNEGGRRYFRFDTTLPGNSNGGHRYGTDLSPEQKDALVEYMKKL